ncbi:hypothetical protein KUTeg_012084, partial [Tegillarca granosa]
MTTINGEYFPSPDPKPHPRVKPEAEAYAQRNRGGMEKWFDYDQNTTYESPRPVQRLGNDEARRNAEINKGCMSSLMGGYADPPANRTIHPRGVKNEGAEMAEANKGGAMKNLLANYGNLGISDRPAPKVKGGDAEEYAERNHGTVDKLMGGYGKMPISPAPAPKVSYGGEEVAENWDEDAPAHRTRPEAEEIVEKNTETQADKLMRGEVAPPTVREVKLPKHLQESDTPRIPDAPPRTRPEAMNIYQKQNHSDMGAIMRGESAGPGHMSPRRNRNQRSED